MKINISGCSTVHELIVKVKHTEEILNRHPNTLILSTVLADILAYEAIGDNFEEEIPRWKKVIGGSIYGLDIFIVSNKGHEYLEVFEVEGRNG